MKEFILITFTLLLIGCSTETITPDERVADSTIHLAGFAGGGAYWKNGEYQALKGEGSVVSSMWVNGASVLIGGFSQFNNIIWSDGQPTTVSDQSGGVTLVASNNNTVFGVWPAATSWVLAKNGVTTIIENTGWPTALSIMNNDAYIAGSSQGDTYRWKESPFYHLDTYAVIWKNEEEIFRESVNSYARSIFIHGSDVYIGGSRHHYPSLNRVACYWKNGTRVELTNENQDAQVMSMFVDATGVYAAGTLNSRAAYWKDGVLVNLPSVNPNSAAYSISVLGNDVYVGGHEDNFPAVWKNGVKQTIPDQDKQGEIRSVIAVSNR